MAPTRNGDLEVERTSEQEGLRTLAARVDLSIRSTGGAPGSLILEQGAPNEKGGERRRLSLRCYGSCSPPLDVQELWGVSLVRAWRVHPS